MLGAEAAAASHQIEPTLTQGSAAQLRHARRITLPISVHRSVTVPGSGSQNGNPDKSTFTVTITGSLQFLRSGTCRVCQIPG